NRAAPLVPLLALILAGCQQSPAPEGKPLVVASFYPMYEFTRQVAAGRAQVISLVPPGGHGHDWEPSPQDVAQVRHARVFVYNGAGFRPWGDRRLWGGAASPRVVAGAGPGLAGAGAGGEGRDPHVWPAPPLARREIDAIRDALERSAPAGKPVYDANASAYGEKLAALDARFDAGLRDCARRDVVGSHAAFGYLTPRYRLTQ